MNGSRLTRGVAFGAVLAVALAAARGAHADASEAETRLAEGRALYDAAKYEEALPKFVQSCALGLPCLQVLRLQRRIGDGIGRGNGQRGRIAAGLECQRVAIPGAAEILRIEGDGGIG